MLSLQPLLMLMKCKGKLVQLQPALSLLLHPILAEALIVGLLRFKDLLFLSLQAICR